MQELGVLIGAGLVYYLYTRSQGKTLKPQEAAEEADPGPPQHATDHDLFTAGETVGMTDLRQRVTRHGGELTVSRGASIRNPANSPYLPSYEAKDALLEQVAAQIVPMRVK